MLRRLALTAHLGKLRTKSALDFEGKASYSVTITVSDGKLTDTISVTINVTDVDENRAPTFADGDSTTREVAENTGSGVDIGTAVSATDADEDDLTYTLGGTDGASFSINSTNGQLRTKSALDFEAKPSYSVTITVSDGKLTDTIAVTINVTDVDENRAPTFADGDSTTREVAENIGSGVDIGSAVSATDEDNDDLTYTIGGSDAAAFDIVSTSGQLRTKSALDFEAKPSYSVTITVSDGKLTDTISVTINVTDVDENHVPVFTEGASTTREVPENTGSGVDIGSVVSATDEDNDDLIYTLGGTDASSFRIVSTNGQLQTSAALDYETKPSYSITITVSDTKNSNDTITITINVTDVFEFTPIGSRTQEVQDAIIAAIDGVDAAADVADAHLSTITELDLRSKSISALLDNDFDGLTALTMLILDDNSLASLPSDLFDGLTNLTNLSVEENLLTSLPDEVFDGLTSLTRLSLRGNSTDPLSLNVSLKQVAEGQFKVQVHAGAPFEMAVPVNVTNGSISGGTATITILKGSVKSPTLTVARTTGTTSAVTVAINTPLPARPSAHTGYKLVNASTGFPLEVIPAVNAPPVFIEGDSTTRSVEEHTPKNRNIGNPVNATDANENDTLTYTLAGTDAVFFSIVNTSGQLKTKAALDYEVKPSYTVTLSVSDERGGQDSITVTINVTDITEILVSDRTQAIRDAIVDKIDDVDSANDVTYDHLATIRSLSLAGETINSLKAGDFSGLIELRILSFRNDDILDDSTGISDISPLAGLTKLTSLDLYHNRVNDISPLENMTNLEKLWLNDNQVTDISPLQNLTDLKRLFVNENNISDISVLSNLTALDHINLSYNSISDISVLSNLTALTHLNISKNSISDISKLENLTALRTLNISENSISDISKLRKLTPLTRLYLWDNKVEDISALSDMTALTDLDLTDNSISDISVLSNLNALINLNLVGNSIEDISALDGLTNLTSLSLASNSIIDISALDGLTNLSRLNLFGNSVTDISSLAELTSLTFLSLAGNTLSDYTQVFPIAINNPNINMYLFESNRSPSFNEGNSTTREVAENTATNTNFGLAIVARDEDVPTNVEQPLTYYLRGTDADSFGVRSKTGTLYTQAALDYDTKSTYEVILFVLDNLGAYAHISVTINVTEVANSAPSAQVSPVSTALLSNYPNPFNPDTWIPYQLAKPGVVKITIYDIRGSVVRHLNLGHQKAGYYLRQNRAAQWDGRNELGERMANGIFFYQLQTDTISSLRKMIILK